MLTTILDEIRKKGLDLAETIYAEMPSEILSYPLTIGNFVECVNAERAVEDFGILQNYFWAQQEVYTKSEKYSSAKKRLQEVKQELKNRQLEQEKRSLLSQERKELSKKIRLLNEELECYVEQKLGFCWKEKKVLCYKNTVFFSWLEDLKSRIVPFKEIRLAEAEKHPFLVSNIISLEKAIGYGEEIGIVGGPCLFGMDEVIFILTLSGGQTVRFDGCCGRRCLNENQTADTLEQFAIKHSKDIVSVEVENRKTGVTRQEYGSIENVFAFAEVLQAKAVIPLPDISYFKYAASDLRGLPDTLRDEVMERFREECYRISDDYLSLIRKFSQQYPSVEYSVLHAREEELVALFYEKREGYINHSSYLKKITNVSGKKDSVIDYITMLALPYYVYGTRTIVQLDSLDETDSGRKCNKIHKGDIRLTQILYPEFLSRDKEHTLYYSPLEYKDYMEPDKEIEHEA